jgi:hypothetical protein
VEAWPEEETESEAKEEEESSRESRGSRHFVSRFIDAPRGVGAAGVAALRR